MRPGPTLPKGLLEQVTPQGKRSKRPPSRKETRKAERTQKKQQHVRPKVTKSIRVEPVKQPIQVKPIETTDRSVKKIKTKDVQPIKQVKPSRQVQDALDRDDADIARLEKKLGIRGKKRKVQDDFGDLLDGIDDAITGQDSDQESKAWLQQKRRRVESPEDLDASESDDPEETGDFSGFSDSDEGEDPQPRVRENPYRPPTEVPNKYVPPSLRQDTQDSRLRRQVQGQVNRLSEANILSIVNAVEDLYRTNARHHITSSLVDILLGLVTDPSPLTDQFIILHAAFVAAVFRSRPEFGALVIERLVTYTGKQSNLMAFLAELYNLDVVACPLVYDYIRKLMSDMTEDSTEVLLRIIRHCGPHLRQDDPGALKEIITKAGTSTSVRHKFLLESMADLQSNRAKQSPLITEHLTRMKKTLGTLKTRQEPLRMTMSDLANTDKRGKWWQVGGVVHDIPAAAPQADDSLTSLTSLAKRQGMNTDVRRAIFVSIMSATDYKDAHTRLLKLDLKKTQAREIPRVLVHCVCAEETYNHFYTLVATQFMDKHASTTFQFCFYDFLKRLDDDSASTREAYNMARMYAALYDKGLRFLHKIDWAYLSPKTAGFLEVLLTLCHVNEDIPGLKYFMQSLEQS